MPPVRPAADAMRRTPLRAQPPRRRFFPPPAERIARPPSAQGQRPARPSRRVRPRSRHETKPDSRRRWPPATRQTNATPQPKPPTLNRSAECKVAATARPRVRRCFSTTTARCGDWRAHGCHHPKRERTENVAPGGRPWPCPWPPARPRPSPAYPFLLCSCRPFWQQMPWKSIPSPDSASLGLFFGLQLSPRKIPGSHERQ